MAEITLRIDGKKKTFRQDYVSWSTRRRAMELEIEGSKEDLNPLEYLDKQADFVVDFFSKDDKPQFTKDQLENGLAADEVRDMLYNIIGVESLGLKSKEELDSLGKQQEEAKNEHQQNEQN